MNSHQLKIMLWNICKNLIPVVLLILFLGACVAEPQENFITIKDVEVKVEIADTPQKYLKGLSGRKSLAEDRGMLFIHTRRDVSSFWMKDMQFPIDIIFIDGDKVVEIAKNMQPPEGENIPEYKSKKPATMVLEVNAGFAEKHSIKVGDEARY